MEYNLVVNCPAFLAFFKVDTELFLLIAFRHFQACTSQKKLNVILLMLVWSWDFQVDHDAHDG